MSKGEVNNKLKVLRAMRNITQEQLAAEVGVTRKTINTVERSIYTPSVAFALRLARYFDTTVEEIFQLN